MRFQVEIMVIDALIEELGSKGFLTYKDLVAFTW